MFMNDVSILVRQMRVFAERTMSDTDVGFPEQIVIMYLAGREASNQDQIARFFDIDKGAIAKTIAKLETKGLVRSKVNERNRREKALSLSPDAHSVIKRMQETLRLWEEQIYEGITDEERRAVERTMERMAKNSHTMIKKGN